MEVGELVEAQPLNPCGSSDSEASAGGTEVEQLDLGAKRRQHIPAVLQAQRWTIPGKDGVAAALDLHPNARRSRMKKPCCTSSPTAFLA